MKILIVDDEKAGLQYLSNKVMATDESELFLARSLPEALEVLEKVIIDVAFVDLQLSADIRNRDGLKLIQEIQKKHKAVPIVVSGHNQMMEVREAMRHGARDYLFKSEIDEEVIAGLLRDLRRRLDLEQEVLDFRARSLPEPPTLGIIGDSEAMKRLRAMIQKVALAPKTDAVLVTGPTGAGKELVAYAIHSLRKERAEPIYAINCGSIPEQLAEAELFGHVKGSFTGATENRDGALKLVGKGILFLDEIGDLPLPLQVKLLRALEQRRFRPIGAAQELPFEGRVVAATNVDIKQRVAHRQFREDLLYRINHLTLEVPPLEKRREDIPALLEHFNRLDGRNLEFSPEALALLCQRPWPGNVRELRQSLAPLALYSDGAVVTPEIIHRALPAEYHVKESDQYVVGPIRSRLAGEEAMGPARYAAQAILDLPARNEAGQPIDKIELAADALFTEALSRTGGHHAQAAELLGVHRKVVNRWVQKKKSGDARGVELPDEPGEQ